MLLNYNISDDDILERDSIIRQQNRTRCRKLTCYSLCLLASISTFGVLLFATIQGWKK
jgi:hypothetical protein